MCYSALAEQELKRLSQDFQATPRLEEFRKLFERRAAGEKLYIPKGMEANFYNPASKEEEEIAALIEGYQTAHVRKLEEDLFKQKTRLVKAERELQTRQTKKLLEDQRIATDKVGKRLKEIEGIKRREPRRTDQRIFPGHYAPVVIEQNGIRSIIPMRYLLRRAGRPAHDDVAYSGCYNARRDNLDQFWKKQFVHTHGLIVVTSFYENVSLHAYERRALAPGESERNLRLQFDPKPEFRMIVACLYSHWQAEGQQDLYSFAAITDEPPPSVAEAGHDRCIVPIKPQNVGCWLAPQDSDSAALHAILADREEATYVPRVELAA